MKIYLKTLLTQGFAAQKQLLEFKNLVIKSKLYSPSCINVWSEIVV